jgi:hypothetical protein
MDFKDQMREIAEPIPVLKDNLLIKEVVLPEPKRTRVRDVTAEILKDHAKEISTVMI